MQSNFNNSVFSTSNPEQQIPQDAQIVFVSDMFASDYAGGAELTTEALLTASPFKVHRVHSKNVSMELLRNGSRCFWIFGNYAQLNPQLIPTIVGNLRYSILEYDFKFCSYRSIEKHEHEVGRPCDCDQQMNGKIISAFMYGAMGLWWMSESQKDRYIERFPFLAEKDNIVLSSVFDSNTIARLKLLRQSTKPEDRSGWIILGSPSWIKGATTAKQWCEDHNKDYEVIWNVPYEETLAKLAVAKGHVYLPPGGDTCPRLVIEAKLLGCKLELNDNVMHRREDWFDTDDLELTESYLLAAPGLFWNGIRKFMNYRPTISGYTTTYNALSQGYPFEECIRSMLQFCDEVCVVDGGSTDDTLLHLATVAYPTAGLSSHIDIDILGSVLFERDEWPDEFMGSKRDPRIKVKIVERDWSNPRHAIYDGMQKAEARAMCTKEFCWQMDADEVVHEDDASKIVEIARGVPKEVPVVALPVLEYWGGPDKVRMDVTPWKWRLTRNLPNVTHGIPAELRRYDEAGELYAAEGTDGCDMIDKETGGPLPCINFYTREVDNVRKIAMMRNEVARRQYEEWFNKVVATLPTVFHYSWYDIERKIRLYRDYWQNHWNSLFNKDVSDTTENNMFFDVPWSDVTDEMIKERAAELAVKTGGWIWHSKWDGTRVPHITCLRVQPAVMKGKIDEL